MVVLPQNPQRPVEIDVRLRPLQEPLVFKPLNIGQMAQGGEAIGVLLLVSAVAVLIFAFSLTGYWTDFFVHVLWAVMLAIVGLILVTRPGISAEAITLMVALYLIATGLLEFGFAYSANIDSLWLYIFQALMSVFLGALLLVGWPLSGIFAIGLFLGVDLMLKGASIIALGLKLREISE